MKAMEARSRVQFKNILFTTDFSSASSAAVPFATELTKRYGAKLFALYVRPPVVNPMTPPLTWVGLEEAAQIEDARHEKELANAFAGIQPEILIKEGDIWSSLTAALEEKNIDLIVLGTRGRSGISKFVLGSIAEEIFRQAPCPVLTVGSNTPAPGKRSSEITKILFATDFSAESSAAAPYAVSLAEECQAYLTLLHVIKAPKAGDLVQAGDLRKSSSQLLHNLVPAEAELWCVRNIW